MGEYGLFVFPTHDDEWFHNKKNLLEANKYAPVAKLSAKSEGMHKNVPSDKAGGLLGRLFLCKGAKFMFTTNLNVKFVFFNGAMGTVIEILYFNLKSPTYSSPDMVMVDFPLMYRTSIF